MEGRAKKDPRAYSRERNVINSLEELDGVADANADNETGVVRVEGKANDEEFEGAIEETGYEVEDF